MNQYTNTKYILITNIIIIFLSFYSYFMSLILISIFLPFFSNQVSKIYFNILFIVIISYILSVFIPEIDSLGYLEFFSSGGKFSESTSFTKTLELAWVYYIKFLNLFISKEYFFLVSNFVMMSLMSVIAFKLSRKNFLLLFIIILFMGFTNNLNFLIRQYYSSIFFIFTLVYINEMRSYFFYILSIGFHLSAIIYLPLLFKSVREFINKYAVSILFISFLLSFLVTIETITSFYDFFNGGGLAERLRYYANSSPDYFKSIFGVNFFEKLFFAFLILLIDYKVLSQLEKEFRSLLIFSLSLTLIFGHISILAERLGFIFIFFFGIFIFILIRREKYISFLKFKFNFLYLMYFYIPLKILLWGFMNEHTHVVKYFNGNILSSGFLN